MGDLTEREIFSRMSDSLGDAISGCVALAERPKKGATYRKLVDDLLLIEGCCRQAAAWRSDARWLAIAPLMEGAHQRAGNFLRWHHPATAFLKLADNLRALKTVCDDLRTKATGIVGTIMPPPPLALQRDTKPVSVILPPGFKTPLKSDIILPKGLGE